MSEILTPSMLIDQPWLVYDASAFHDEWEEYMRTLPKNMTVAHHIGSRSFWETFVGSPNGRKMNLYAQNYPPIGEQLPEDEYAEAMARAKELAQTHKVHHVRADLAGAVEETWRNTGFRYIEGHSFHKIHPVTLATDYIEVEGKLWHIRDYYEQQIG